jgi:hypothetical protein
MQYGKRKIILRKLIMCHLKVEFLLMESGEGEIKESSGGGKLTFDIFNAL